MTVDMFLRALRARALIVTVCALIGLLGGVAVFLLAPKTYTSEAQLVVEVDADVDQGAFDVSTFIQSQLPTYMEIAQATSTVEEIRDAMGESAPEDLSGHLSYTIPEGANVIAISGTGSTPEQAKDIADAAADELTSVLAPRNLGSEGLDVVLLQEGTSPASSTSPDPVIVLPMGLAIGLLAGVLLALVLTTRDPYARTLGDVRDVAQAPVLGVLPQAPQRKMREEAAKDYVPTTFAGLFSRLGSNGKSQTARLLTVASVDPEVGAAWLAWGIVRTASASGLRCAIVATRSAPLEDWNRARHLDGDDDRAVRVVDVGRSGFDGVLTTDALEREVRGLVGTFDLVVFVADSLADDPDNRAYLELSARVLLGCSVRPTKASLVTARELSHAGDAQVAGVVMVDPENISMHPGSTSRRYNNSERSSQRSMSSTNLPQPTEPIPMISRGDSGVPTPWHVRNSQKDSEA